MSRQMTASAQWIMDAEAGKGEGATRQLRTCRLVAGVGLVIFIRPYFSQ